MIICAFETSPSIPSFLVTKIVYIGYGQLKQENCSRAAKGVGKK
jgi:hypothetical protein